MVSWEILFRSNRLIDVASVVTVLVAVALFLLLSGLSLPSTLKPKTIVSLCLLVRCNGQSQLLKEQVDRLNASDVAVCAPTWLSSVYHPMLEQPLHVLERWSLLRYLPTYMGLPACWRPR